MAAPIQLYRAKRESRKAADGAAGKVPRGSGLRGRASPRRSRVSEGPLSFTGQDPACQNIRGKGGRGGCHLGKRINRSGAGQRAGQRRPPSPPARVGSGRVRRRQGPAGPALCCRDNRVALRAGSQAGSEGTGLAAVRHVRRAQGGAVGPGPGAG